MPRHQSAIQQSQEFNSDKAFSINLMDTDYDKNNVTKQSELPNFQDEQLPIEEIAMTDQFLQLNEDFYSLAYYGFYLQKHEDKLLSSQISQYEQIVTKI